MYLQLVVETCQGSGRNFRAVKVIFDQNYNNDRKFIESLLVKGKELANEVNKSAANNSSLNRDDDRVLINCTAGILAEVCWKKCINYYYNQEYVTETNFDKAANQIDLKIIHSNKTIEVRSSFPKNGINFALCHPIYEFDVIGPYTNSVKPSEPAKDFYVRTLYPINASCFFEFLEQESIEFFLTGGAKWDMMLDEDISQDKDFIPDDTVYEQQTSYRVVPFSKALDTIGILKEFNS